VVNCAGSGSISGVNVELSFAHPWMIKAIVMQLSRRIAFSGLVMAFTLCLKFRMMAEPASQGFATIATIFSEKR
jgi:hypothetical protein